MYAETVHTREKYSESDIQEQVKRIAQEIYRDMSLIYKNKVQPHLVVLCVLKGAVPFCSDLIKWLDYLPVVIDYIELSSYNGKTSSSREIKLKKDISLDPIFINYRDVLIVEDIVDSGLTMDWLIHHINSKYKVNSLKIATLINKTFRREKNIKINYIGFEDDSVDFLAGYGLDYNEAMRNTNNIVEIIK